MANYVKYLENTSDGHSKFYRIEADGNLIKARYGKIGQKGREIVIEDRSWQGTNINHATMNAQVDYYASEKVKRGYKVKDDKQASTEYIKPEPKPKKKIPNGRFSRIIFGEDEP